MPFFRQMQEREKRRWVLALLTGFLAGIAAVCLLPGELVQKTGFLDSAFLDKIRYLELDQNRLLLYILQQRLGAAAFLVLLSAAGMTAGGIWLFGSWYGMSVGAVLTVLSMRYGIRGLLFFLACIWPQQLLLAPGYLLLFGWCAKRADSRRLLLAVGTLILGGLAECYVNPVVIKAVIKIF